MQKWLILCLAAVAAASAQDPDFAPRASSAFLHRYEAVAGDPLTEAPGEWESPYFAPERLAFEPGVIDVHVTMNRYWRLTPALLAELDHQKGWTLEVRLRILEQTGQRGTLSMAVDDEPGQPGVLSGLQIHAARTQFCLDGAVVDSSRNDDGFHTFRIAEGPGSRTVHAWRDGCYLGSTSFPYYMVNQPSFLLVGSLSGRVAGSAEIDYIRWDPTGPYAPAQSLLLISESGSVTRVCEKGAKSDTFTVVLSQTPAAPVAITFTPGFGASRAEDIDLGAGPGQPLTLQISPADWQVPRMVTVSAVDDTLKEWLHSSIVQCLSRSSDARFDSLEETLTVFVIDNDEVVRRVETGGTTEVWEEGSTADVYTVELGLLPDHPVQLALYFDPRRLRVNESAASPLLLTVTPAEAGVPLPIRVAAFDNSDRDLLKRATIRHLLTSADPLFDHAPLPDLRVRIHENDTKHLQAEAFTIPMRDLDQPDRQVVVDRQPGQYLGHVTTVLLADSTTLLAVYPKGHGSGMIVYKRSFDGGVTWSRALATPPSWATSKEVPTLFRMTDPQGVERLILFSGLYPARRAWSADNGVTWSELEPVGDWGGIVVMGGAIRLRDGRYMALFHDDGRFIAGGGKAGDTFTVYKTLSPDGGLTWSYPEALIECDWADPCEPGIVRSPDGNQLLVLLRENSRAFNSFCITSNDEGESWSPLIELPAALTGDRHTAQYTKDGRLFISFRDMAKGSPTWGDWVGWLGTYEDIIHGREGQYRIRLKKNTGGSDTAYPGVECLPLGMLVVTTYGHWLEGEQPFIVSTRFMPQELEQRFTPLPVQPCRIVVYGDGTLAPQPLGAEILPGYTGRLAGDLDRIGMAATVFNRGAVGTTSDAGLRRFQEVVLALHPDLVLLQFGGEDARVQFGQTPTGWTPQVPLDRFVCNMTAMVRQLKALGIRPLLVTAPPLAWGDSTVSRYGLPLTGSPFHTGDPFGLNTVQSRYNAALREVAVAEAVQLVDLYGRFISYANVQGKELTDLVPDGLHPSVTAERMIAEAICAVLGVAVPEQTDGVKPGKSQKDADAGKRGEMKFGLEGNYPNPFNPATEVVFALPQPGAIRLEVLDVRGRRVRTLAEGFYPRGRHLLPWNARDSQERPVAAGVYWARLSSGAAVAAHKMVVLR
ncbi:MAG TPA: GDSL-type esterase/lipase family protein [bacterium]|nr:GDSL-type esterase/lipase family protein [bacterium]HQI49834.1 GDSL-type esterase/lipase family protein [bacterium]HQJ65674.1 GDSL-type esterase/lipase family protein [bacterium]